MKQLMVHWCNSSCPRIEGIDCSLHAYQWLVLETVRTSACRGLGLGDAFSGRQFSAVIAQNNIDRWDHENGEQRGGRQAEQQRDGETLKDRIDQDCGRPDHRRQCR